MGKLHLLLVMVSISLGTSAVITSCASADNNLTKGQISSGWIMLFDGETTFGWKMRGESDWSVKDGAVLVSSGKPSYFATTTEFADYELQADVWIDNKANSGIFLRTPVDGDFDTSKAYEVNIYDAHRQWPTGSINSLQKSKSRVKSVGNWTHFDIIAEGDHLIVATNGKKVVDVHDSKFNRGVIALQYGGEGTAKFKNLYLKPLSLKSIFNGKDLTSWSVIPEHKSVYTVTPEGWLNVKNGNGDIQTEGTWGDLALQIDVFSNGDHLNSGVFFRATKGLFWSGYEDQIRNQWAGDDRTKAIDYGTGGIYNRQPARKVVSSDREWFKMTLVAHGYHIGSWVNGYMVADFHDPRPVNEGNARQGARKAPGVISLQGHDPTTDLSFKNINVVELPAKKD